MRRQETGLDDELNTLTVSADIREFDVLPTQPGTQFDPFPHTEPAAARPPVSRDFAAKPYSESGTAASRNLPHDAAAT